METINRRKIGMLSKFWLTKQGELEKESCFEDFKKELRVVFPYILFHSLTLSDMKIYMYWKNGKFRKGIHWNEMTNFKVEHCLKIKRNQSIILGLFIGGFVWAIYFVVGVLTWTLTEYLLHRFVFHWHPDPNSGKKLLLHFLLHGNSSGQSVGSF